MSGGLVQIRGQYDPDSWFGIVTVNGNLISPAASLKLRRHSPDGFAWGYGGSGPAQLALAILLAAGVEQELALLRYQDFKAEFLVNVASNEPLSLDIDIRFWIATFRRDARPVNRATL